MLAGDSQPVLKVVVIAASPWSRGDHDLGAWQLACIYNIHKALQSFETFIVGIQQAKSWGSQWEVASRSHMTSHLTIHSDLLNDRS